jgi:hypothetical protein
MFNVSFKNPLEAETVGERRERKAKESEGSIRSQRSASRAKLLDGSLISKKFPLFGLSRGAKTETGALDVVEKLRAPAKGDVIVAPSELAGSPVFLPLASHPPPTKPYTRTLSELSISPSISRREGMGPYLRTAVLR